jgi:hypothetical protein
VAANDAVVLITMQPAAGNNGIATPLTLSSRRALVSGGPCWVASEPTLAARTSFAYRFVTAATDPDLAMRLEALPAHQRDCGRIPAAGELTVPGRLEESQGIAISTWPE